MRIKIRLAVRDWDYFTPLALGDISSERLDIALDRVHALTDLEDDPHHDAAEISFSRYVSSRERGETEIIGLPNFIMRGFRQRCIITTKRSPLTRIKHLAGKRIGVTGWRDSGNTWTRAVLSRVGVGIEDAYWFAGRLTASHPILDRLDGFGRPGCIEAVPGERPMMELLETGELDAVFTPFMPDGFFSPNSRFRPLLSDFRAEERAYFNAVGYVPGMHVLGFKAAFANEYPWALKELSDLLDLSQRIWLEKRRKYAETTPWIMDELIRSAHDLPSTWNDSGLTANERMIADFARELHAQGIAQRMLSPAEIFPYESGL